MKFKKKTKNKNRTNANKNPIKIHRKEEIEQGYDKKTYPKLVLNKVNVMKNIPLFIPIEHLVQRSFSRNSQSTCGPCAPMCTHV
jgi:hypothetical protein